MSFLLAIILGLFQGLTEFLPVSSSGHLTIIQLWFGQVEASVFYNIILHFATLLALVVVMFKDVFYVFSRPLEKDMRNILLSTIITGVIGIFMDIIFGAEGSLVIVAIGFIITAILLFVLKFYISSKKYNPNGKIGTKQAIIVGAVQGIAVMPGLSRSGSTLVAGVLSGANQKNSAKFSFLLSIPIILGGVVYETYKGIKYGFGFNNSDILPMIVGFVVAFVSAVLTLKLMLKLLEKNKWQYFAIYLIIVGVILLVTAII